MTNGVAPAIVGPNTIGQLAPPGGIGQLAAIAVGAWTAIVGVFSTPVSAAPGDLVNVQVTVQNLADYGIYIAVASRYDNTELRFSPEYAAVAPQGSATHTFTSSFIMPDKDVQVSIWSFFWTGTEWFQDDYKLIDIALTGAPPEDGVQIMSVNTYIVK